MPFNYDGLKRITGAGLVDTTIVTDDIANNTLVSSDIADGAVTTAKLAVANITSNKIQNNSVVAAKLADGAIPLGGAKVAGTLPNSKGGTGLSFTSGSAGYALRTDGSGNIELSQAGLIRCKTYISNSTWTKTADVTRLWVQCVGGGAGGTGHGEAGGAGGYSERYIDVSGLATGATVSVTIGGASGGNNYHNACSNAAASSFGPYLSASGGEGARQIGGHTGGRPGIGSGGDLNIYGGGGAGHTQHGGGLGGTSYYGGSAIGVHNNSPHTYDHETRAAPGAGGTGGARNHNRGANGKDGMIIVWEYR
jgi:hypothetical protein